MNTSDTKSEIQYFHKLIMNSMRSFVEDFAKRHGFVVNDGEGRDFYVTAKKDDVKKGAEIRAVVYYEDDAVHLTASWKVPNEVRFFIMGALHCEEVDKENWKGLCEDLEKVMLNNEIPSIWGSA